MTTDTTAAQRLVGTLRTADGKGVVHVEDRFDSTVDDLWSALTAPDRLARWLGDLAGDLRQGGTFNAHFFASDWAGTGHVDVCEPPHHLRLTTTDADGAEEHVIEATLTADGGHTLLVLEERGMPVGLLPAYGAGVQIHVEDLAAHLAGQGRCDAVARWKQLQPGYEARALDLVRQSYAAVAGLYIELFGSRELVHADDLAFIGRHLGARPGTVLDLGCGPGHLSEHLRSLGVDATGIDLVPEFIAHARAAHPDGSYQLGSLAVLDVADHSLDGILAWYSLIHLPPHQLDGVLAGFRRALAPGGTLVVGVFDAAFDGQEVSAFDHKVVTAYRWPVEEFVARLARAGFTEVERMQRPSEGGHRPHAAIAAVATAA